MDNFYSVTVYEKVRAACCRDVSTLLLWDGFGASALSARGGGVFLGGGRLILQGYLIVLGL